MSPDLNWYDLKAQITNENMNNIFTVHSIKKHETQDF